MTSQIVLSYGILVTLYSFHHTYNSFALPFQGRILNTGAAEATGIEIGSAACESCVTYYATLTRHNTIHAQV